MALQKQVITLDFGYGGLDQKSDEKRVLPVRFTELTDVRFNKVGRVDRRPGHAAVGAIADTVSKIIDTGDGIGFFANHSGFSSAKAYRVTAGNVSMTAVDRGGALAVVPVPQLIAEQMNSTIGVAGTSSIGTNVAYISRVDSQNCYCVVSADPDGAVAFYAEIHDLNTNESITLIGFNGVKPRIVVHPDGRDQFVVVYVNGTTVSAQTFSATNATSVTVAGQPDETTVAGNEFDVWVCADNVQSQSAVLFVAYAKSATGMKLRSSPWPTGAGAGATLSTTTVAPSAGNVTRVAISEAHNWADASANVPCRVMWFESGTGIRTATFNHSCTMVFSTTTISVTATVPNFITGTSSSNAEFILAEFDTGTLAAYEKQISTFQGAISSFSPAPAIRGLGLASRPCARPNSSAVYFWTTYESPNQNTMFLIERDIVLGNSGACLVGRVFHTTSQPCQSHTTSCLANLQYTSKLIGACAALKRATSSTDPSQARYAAYALKVDLDPGTGWLSTGIVKNEQLFTGGYPFRVADSGGPAPLLPLVFPRIVSLSATTVGGSMALGSYAVSGYFEHLDENGVAHRSAPALPVTFSLTGTQNAIIATIETYRLPDAINEGGRLRFVAARTLSNESQVYYTTTSVTIQPNTALSTTTVALTLADASVSVLEPMYTTGGVFENWMPSAPIAIATNGRRTLIVSGQRPTFVYEGKPNSNEFGTSFMEDVGRDVLTGGSRIYALASYLDKWFAFKETSIFVAQGDGADVTGQNDTLSEFQPLSAALGTTQPRSVISTADGVIFNSQKGFFIIGGDLQATYIGDAVEDYTSPVIDSAYDDVNDVVYFVLADGTCLVLSLFVTAKGVDPRWSVDTIVAVNSVATFSGVRYFAPKAISGLASSIYKETPGTFIDTNVSTTAVPAMAATTAWTAMGQIQGFGRIWKALCLGTFPPAQLATLITVQIGYDYSNTWTESHTILSTAFQQNGNNAQFEIRPARQKCESIRFRITQGAPASGTAQGLFLNQIQLVVGVKANDNKTPATSRMTKG